MKRKLLLFLVTLLPLLASAYDAKIDGIYYNFSGNEAEVTYQKHVNPASVDYFSDYLGAIAIPESVTYNETTYYVTAIGSNAFYGCTGVTSITIPTSVTSIGRNAFERCRNLSSINIPESVTSIDDNAFSDCSSLTSVNIPNSIESIGCGVFASCSSLSSINIPESVTSIGERAFYGCSNLASINIPENVTSIGEYAFHSTLWYNNQPDGVVYAGKVAYTYKGEMPGNTQILLREGTLGVAEGAFKFCGLAFITIPGSVTTIGRNSFYGCNDLTSITIPNSVTNIGDTAFYGCKSIKKAEIYSPAETDWGFVFYECNLDTVIFGGNVTPTLWGGASYGRVSHVIIEDGLTSIGSYAFLNCSGLTSITIPNSVTSIEDFAFSGCSGLTSIIIPEGVTSIGEYAFNGCYELNIVTISCQKPIEITPNTFSIDEEKIPLLRVPVGSKEAYKQAEGWNLFPVIAELGEGSNIVFADTLVKKICISKFDLDGDGEISDIEAACVGEREMEMGLFCFTDIQNFDELEYFIGLKTFYMDFQGCYRLLSITIPENVTNIGYKTFSDCWSLTSITIPNSVTSIGNSAFEGCSGLTSVTSYIEEPFAINNVFDSNTYNTAILYVPIGAIEVYEATDGWKNFKNITVIDGGTNIALSVTDESGANVTNKVSIVWYNAEGQELGTGNKLNGVADSTVVYYSVLLDETMGRVYREVKMQKVMTGEDNKTITCQLERIGRVMLEGRVSATDIDKTTATVNVSQMLNGKWEQTYTTQTNEQGVFNVEVYDDETDITISGEGYLDATIHRERFGESGNVGTIPLNLISGFSIAANITMQKAVIAEETEDVVAWTEGLNNIEFALTNTTKSMAITDFTVQNGNVIIKTGADVGDEISLTAKSKQGMFANATTTFTIADGANAFDLQLTEMGGIDATCTGTNNGVTVGYLYNSYGVLTAKGTYTGETLSMRHLPNGTYTLITMGSSTLLHNMTHLADIVSVGLSEGTDYVATNLEIKDGELTVVAVNEVPRLDDTRFYYTSGETYFNVNKTSVTAGNYLTLQAHVNFKAEYADKTNGVTLTIDLPEGCQMVENSVVANRQAVPHTLNGKRLSMTLNKEQYDSQVRFCVIPTFNQSYTITAMASFDINGQVTQPIGTAQFEVKGLSLSLLEKVANTNVTINGTAKGHSDVSIYDNDVLIGKTTSKADGSWTAECELFKPYSHSFHDIYARITTENGMELTSEVRKVEYDKNGNVPEKVTMLYYNPEIDTNYNIVFDLIKGTTTPSSYYYFPYKNWPNWWQTYETEPKDFTFLADFTRNDSTVIKNVNIKVLNSDGTVRTLPAIFDDKQNKWVATTKYENSNRLPQNVAVEYDCIPNSEIYDEEMDKAMTSIINNMLIEVENAYKDCALELIAEDDNSALLSAKTNGYNTHENFAIKILDYEQVKTQYESEPYCHIVNDTTDMCFVVNSFDDNKSSIVAWDNLNISACEISTGVVLSQNMSNRRRILPFILSAGYGIVSSIGEYYLRKPEIDSWNITLESERNNRWKYYNKLQPLLNAKCPDGNYKIKDETQNRLLESIFTYSESVQQYLDDFQTVIDRQQFRLKQFCATKALGDVTLSFVAGPLRQCTSTVLTNIGGKILGILGKALENHGIGLLSEVANQGISEALNYYMDNPEEGGERKDISPEKIISQWYSNKSKQLTNEYVNLVQSIKGSYSKCEKKEDKDEPKEEKTNGDSGSNNDFKGNGSTPSIDPSGYVYEAVESNRLEGVTVTCYQKVIGEDMYGDITEEAVVWNAEDFSQQNPLQTDETGFYRWDVPQGMWQVKYEKEGYETTYSDWLPVPPPQLDVNISMKQSTPPTVKQVRGYESGITIELSKYIRPETITTENITVTRNGIEVAGSIEMLNAEMAPLGGETYVSKVKFVPEHRFNTSNLVVVTIHKEVESYCGVKMTADYIESVKIEPEVKAIVVDSVLTVPYQRERDLRIQVLPKEASTGKILHVKTSSMMLVSISAPNITIDQNGFATLKLGGELPGVAMLRFNVDGTDIAATAKVNVVMNSGTVATPVPNINDGDTVESGTLLNLTCSTEGATIYYTIDGSCPCDEQKRILYTGPFVLPDGTVTVNAIAVAEGLDDSDVMTCVYYVQENSQESETITFANSNMRTFCSANSLDFSCVEGLDAFISSGFSAKEGEVIMTKVEIAPAQTGLLLVGEPNKSYEVPFTKTSLIYSNLFVGVLEDTEINNGYVLGNGKFEAVNGDLIVKGGGAYLRIPSANGKKQLNIKFTDTLTGVEDMKTEEQSEWHTLQGVRFNHKPVQRGIYLYQGNKLLIK